MSISMYDASIPVFVRLLGNLSAILAKAENTTTYAILRHNGLDIGKSDYLGAN